MKFIPRVSALAAIALSLWSPAASAQEPAGVRSLLSQLYGDLAFEVRTKGLGSLTVGVADEKTQVVITLLATDLRRWSDSATRMLAARGPRKGSSITWQAVVDGPGTVAGSMALSRAITPTDTTIILLVTDTAFRAVRTPLRMEEAKALAVAMKRAANASLPTKPAPIPRAGTGAPPKKPPGNERQRGSSGN
jgi:hypothetical protein